MGGGASTNVVDIQGKINSVVKQNCASFGAANETFIRGVKIRCPPNCTALPCGTLNIDQTINVDSKCLIDQTARTITDILTDQKAKVEGGLGIEISNNIKKENTDVNQYLEAKCGDKDDTTQLVDLSNTEIDACGGAVNISQNLTAKKRCQLNTISDIIHDTTVTQEAAATGWFGGSSGMFAIIIIVIVVVIVGGVGGYYYLQSQKKIGGAETSDSLFETFTESLSSATSTKSYFYWIIIIVIIAMILVSINKPSSTLQIEPGNVSISPGQTNNTKRTYYQIPIPTYYQTPIPTYNEDIYTHNPNENLNIYNPNENPNTYNNYTLNPYTANDQFISPYNEHLETYYHKL
jgi:hypothetical protein